MKIILVLLLSAAASVIPTSTRAAAGDLYVIEYITNTVFKFTRAGSKSTFTSELVPTSGLAFDRRRGTSLLQIWKTVYPRPVAVHFRPAISFDSLHREKSPLLPRSHPSSSAWPLTVRTISLLPPGQRLSRSHHLGRRAPLPLAWIKFHHLPLTGLEIFTPQSPIPF